MTLVLAEERTSSRCAIDRRFAWGVAERTSTVFVASTGGLPSKDRFVRISDVSPTAASGEHRRATASSAFRTVCLQRRAGCQRESPGWSGRPGCVVVGFTVAAAMTMASHCSQATAAGVHGDSDRSSEFRAMSAFRTMCLCAPESLVPCRSPRGRVRRRRAGTRGAELGVTVWPVCRLARGPRLARHRPHKASPRWRVTARRALPGRAGHVRWS